MIQKSFEATVFLCLKVKIELLLQVNISKPQKGL